MKLVETGREQGWFPVTTHLYHLFKPVGQLVSDYIPEVLEFLGERGFYIYMEDGQIYIGRGCENDDCHRRLHLLADPPADLAIRLWYCAIMQNQAEMKRASEEFKERGNRFNRRLNDLTGLFVQELVSKT